MNIKNVIEGCKKNDAKSQKELVIRYSSLLLTVSRRYMPSGMDAEDILQDSFIKIFEYIHQFDPSRGTLEAWMRKIVINTALRRLNKACFKKELYVQEMPERSIQPSIYEQLGAEDIMSLVAELPDGQRHVFNLYTIDGYSHKEISQILGITEVNSRAKYSRARNMLKKKIAGLKTITQWMKIG